MLEKREKSYTKRSLEGQNEDPAKAAFCKRTKGETRWQWTLRLYVAGQTPNSTAAFDNLKRLCEGRLKGRYTIEVIDLLKNPRLAKDDQILAIPTVVRTLPQPVRRIIGDLSNTEELLIGLDLRQKIQREPQPYDI